jgi:hypothetical protein
MKVFPKALLGSRNLYRLTAISIYCIASINGHAQSFGAGVGTVGGETQVTAVTTDTAGNTYIAGTFYGPKDLAIGNAHTNWVSTGGTDGFVAKLDANGLLVWSQHLFGFGATQVKISGLAMDPKGNLLLSGSFDGGDLTWSFANGAKLKKIGTQDGFIAKVDVGGLISAAQNFGGPGVQVDSSNVVSDPNGDVYFAASFGGGLTTPAMHSIGTKDAMVVHINAASFAGYGKSPIAWVRSFGGKGVISWAQGVGVDNQGDVYLAGIHAGDMTTPALKKIGIEDGFTVKLAPNSATLWAKNFGGAGSLMQTMQIAVDQSGNPIIAGLYTGNLTNPSLAAFSGGKISSYAIKLAAKDGTTAWARNLGGDGAEAQVVSLAVEPAGDVVLGVNYYGKLSQPAIAPIDSDIDDSFAVKLAGANGNPYWLGRFGADTPGGTIWANSVAVDAQGDVLLGGYFSKTGLKVPQAIVQMNPSAGFPSLDEGFVFKVNGNRR